MKVVGKGQRHVYVQTERLGIIRFDRGPFEAFIGPTLQVEGVDTEVTASVTDDQVDEAFADAAALVDALKVV